MTAPRLTGDDLLGIVNEPDVPVVVPPAAAATRPVAPTGPPRLDGAGLLEIMNEAQPVGPVATVVGAVKRAAAAAMPTAASLAQTPAEMSVTPGLPSVPTPTQVMSAQAAPPLSPEQARAVAQGQPIPTFDENLRRAVDAENLRLAPLQQQRQTLETQHGQLGQERTALDALRGRLDALDANGALGSEMSALDAMRQAIQSTPPPTTPEEVARARAAVEAFNQRAQAFRQNVTAFNGQNQALVDEFRRRHTMHATGVADFNRALDEHTRTSTEAWRRVPPGLTPFLGPQAEPLPPLEAATRPSVMPPDDFATLSRQMARRERSKSEPGLYAADPGSELAGYRDAPLVEQAQAEERRRFRPAELSKLDYALRAQIGGEAYDALTGAIQAAYTGAAGHGPGSLARYITQQIDQASGGKLGMEGHTGAEREPQNIVERAVSTLTGLGTEFPLLKTGSELGVTAVRPLIAKMGERWRDLAIAAGVPAEQAEIAAYRAVGDTWAVKELLREALPKWAEQGVAAGLTREQAVQAAREAARLALTPAPALAVRAVAGAASAGGAVALTDTVREAARQLADTGTITEPLKVGKEAVTGAVTGATIGGLTGPITQDGLHFLASTVGWGALAPLIKEGRPPTAEDLLLAGIPAAYVYAASRGRAKSTYTAPAARPRTDVTPREEPAPPAPEPGAAPAPEPPPAPVAPRGGMGGTQTEYGQEPVLDPETVGRLRLTNESLAQAQQRIAAMEPQARDLLLTTAREWGRLKEREPELVDWEDKQRLEATRGEAKKALKEAPPIVKLDQQALAGGVRDEMQRLMEEELARPGSAARADLEAAVRPPKVEPPTAPSEPAPKPEVRFPTVPDRMQGAQPEPPAAPPEDEHMRLVRIPGDRERFTESLGGARSGATVRVMAAAGDVVEWEKSPNGLWSRVDKPDVQGTPGLVADGIRAYGEVKAPTPTAIPATRPVDASRRGVETVPAPTLEAAKPYPDLTPEQASRRVTADRLVEQAKVLPVEKFSDLYYKGRDKAVRAALNYLSLDPDEFWNRVHAGETAQHIWDAQRKESADLGVKDPFAAPAPRTERTPMGEQGVIAGTPTRTQPPGKSRPEGRQADTAGPLFEGTPVEQPELVPSSGPGYVPPPAPRTPGAGERPTRAPVQGDPLWHNSKIVVAVDDPANGRIKIKPPDVPKQGNVIEVPLDSVRHLTRGETVKYYRKRDYPERDYASRGTTREGELPIDTSFSPKDPHQLERFVRAHGGVAPSPSGDLKGEYAAVPTRLKSRTGMSADAMAQAITEEWGQPYSDADLLVDLSKLGRAKAAQAAQPTEEPAPEPEPVAAPLELTVEDVVRGLEFPADTPERALANDVLGAVEEFIDAAGSLTDAKRDLARVADGATFGTRDGRQVSKAFVQDYLDRVAPAEATSTTPKAAPVFDPGAADAALKRLRDKFRAPAPRDDEIVRMATDFSIIPDLVAYGGMLYEGGLRDLEAWSKKMIADVGPAVRPYLSAAFDLIGTHYRQATTGEAPPRDPDDLPASTMAGVQDAPPTPSASSSGEEYSYSSTQIELPEDLGNRIKAWAQQNIEARDLKGGGVGIETHPHVTAKYGVHTSKPGAIQAALEGQRPFPVTLGDLGVFRQDDQDVLYIDVKGPQIRQLNRIVSDAVRTTDTHAQYHPHVTVAYLKKGLGTRYVREAASPFSGTVIQVDHVDFMPKDGSTPKRIALGAPEQSAPKPSGGYEHAARLRTLVDLFRGRIETKDLPKDPRELRKIASAALKQDVRFISGDAPILDDIYDALEAAVNGIYRERRVSGDPLPAQIDRAVKTEDWLGTRSKTIEARARQQFSTPLPIAEVAAFAADVRPGDTVLEPTAGTGNLLAPLPKDVTVHAVELDPRRAETLRLQGYDATRADYLKAAAPKAGAETASVVLMNPPWGKHSTKKYGPPIPLPYGQPVDIAERFVVRALRDLPTGGRLVAVMPTTTLESRAFLDWLAREHTLRAVVTNPPGSYESRGTTVNSVILVVDKGRQEDAPAPIRAAAAEWSELARLVEPLAGAGTHARPALRPGAPGPARVEPGAGDLVGQPGRAPAGAAGPAQAGAAPVDVAGGRAGRQPQAGVPGLRGDVAAGAGNAGPGVVAPRGGRPGAISGPAPRGLLGEPGRDLPGVEEGQPVALPDPTGERFSVADPRELEAASGSALFAPAALRSAPGRSPHPRLIVLTRSLAGAPRPPLTYKPRGRLIAQAYARGVISDQQLDYGITPALQANAQGKGYLGAADVGVGKTRIAALVAGEWLETGDAKRILYVTATEVNVQDVIKEFDVAVGGTFPFEIQQVRTFKEAKEKPGSDTIQPLPPLRDGQGIYLIDRYNLVAYWKALKGVALDGVIGDEAHLYQNIEGAKVGKAWLDLEHDVLGRRGKFLYLTATPAVDFDDLEHFVGLREWTAGAGFSDYKARVTGTAPESDGDLRTMRQEFDRLRTAWVQAPNVPAAERARVLTALPDVDARGMARERTAQLFNDGINALRQALLDHGQNSAAAVGGDSDAAGVTAAGGRKRGFMQGRDVFGARITPAEQEQIMRELAMKGLYDSVDLWRAGVEFSIVTQPLTTEQLEEYARLTDFYHRLQEAFERFGRLNELKHFYTIRHFLQQEAKRRMFDYRLEGALAAARASLERGEQVVFATISVSETTEETGPIPAAINSINAKLIEVGDEGQILTEEEIPEALVARAELLDEWSRFRQLKSPVQMIVQEFGADKVAVIVGDTPPKRREKMIAEFQGGTRTVAIISDAGKTGISLHHVVSGGGVAAGRRHLIVMDYDWSARTFKQLLGRVDRSGQLSAPRITALSTGAAAERKFLATIANRMRNLGALSKGSAESASNEQLVEYEIGGALDTQAMRLAYQGLAREIQEAFLAGNWRESIADPGKVGSSGRSWENTRGYPKEATLKDFLLDLQFMSIDLADRAFQAFWGEREKLIAAQQAENPEADLVGRTRANRGRLLRSTTLATDLTLHEVADDNGHRFGVLQGLITPNMALIRPFLPTSNATMAPIRHYLTFAAGDQQMAGLEIRPGAISPIKRAFGHLGKVIETPEDALEALRAGDTVPLEGRVGYSLKMRPSDKLIVISGAAMADKDQLLRYGAQYRPVGNLRILPEHAMAQFLERYPVKRPRSFGPTEEPPLTEEAAPAATPERAEAPLSQWTVLVRTEERADESFFNEGRRAEVGRRWEVRHVDPDGTVYIIPSDERGMRFKVGKPPLKGFKRLTAAAPASLPEGEGDVARMATDRPLSRTSKARRDEIVRLYQEGVGYDEISRRLGGVSDPTIKAALLDAGVEPRRQAPTEEKKRAIVEMYRAGGVYEAIKAKLRTSDRTIIIALREAGLEPKQRGGTTFQYDQALRDEAVRLYTEEQLAAPDIAGRLDVNATTVTRWVREAGMTRTGSEARAMRSTGQGQRVRGVSAPWQSAKTREWSFAHSMYELARMNQLDHDPSVATWTKKVDRVQLPGGRYYQPDLLVTYTDGRRVVEEVKPSFQVNRPDVVAKSDAAAKYFAARGIGYRFVTEREIGVDGFRDFLERGIGAVDEDNSGRALRSARSAIAALEADRAPLEQEAGGEATAAPLKAEGTPTTPQMFAPPGDRWIGDQGAIPGEPSYYLDAPGGDLESAKAVIVERVLEGRGVSVYDLFDAEGAHLGEFNTPFDAAEAAEARFPAAGQPLFMAGPGETPATERERFQRAVDGGRELPGTPGLRLIDTTEQTSPALLAEAARAPYLPALATEIGRVFDEVAAVLLPTRPRPRFAGVSVDSGYRGVNLRRRGEPNTVLFNPWVTAQLGSLYSVPDAWVEETADFLWDVILHELTHEDVRAHDDAFYAALEANELRVRHLQDGALERLRARLTGGERGTNIIHSLRELADRLSVEQGRTGRPQPPAPGAAEAPRGWANTGGAEGGPAFSETPRRRPEEGLGRRRGEAPVRDNRPAEVGAGEPGPARASGAANELTLQRRGERFSFVPAEAEAFARELRAQGQEVELRPVGPLRTVWARPAQTAPIAGSLPKATPVEPRPASTTQGYAPVAEAPQSDHPTLPGYAHPTTDAERQQVEDKRRLILHLAHVFDVPIRVGRMAQGPSTQGIFKVKPEVIRIRRASMLGVAAHEIGHFLRKRQLLDTAGYEDALGSLAEGLKGDPLEEGAAQFVRHYVENPDYLTEKGLNGLTARFEATMQREWPDGLAALLDARGKYVLWRNQPLMARFDSIIDRSPKARGWERFKEGVVNYDKWWNRFYTVMFDDLHPIKLLERAGSKGEPLSADKSAYIAARLARGEGGRAEVFINDHPIDFHTAGLRTNIPGLKDILGTARALSGDVLAPPVWKNRALFESYLIARRTQEMLGSDSERLAKAGETMLGQVEASPQAVNEAVAQVEREHPEFVEAAEELQKWNDALLDYMKASGRYSPEVIAAIKKLHRNYVPFYRVFEEWPDDISVPGGGNRFADLPSPVKTLKGSERRIVSPLESLLKNAYAMIAVADRNEIGNLMVDMLERTEGYGRLMEPVPPKMRATTFNLLELKPLQDALAEAGIIDPEGQLGLDLDRLASVFRPVWGREKDVVTLYRKGEPQKWQIDPWLYRAMMNLDRLEMPFIARWLEIPARVFRSGVVLTPIFQIRNYIRDQMTVWIQSGGIPFYHSGRALIEKLGGSSDLEARWKAAGGAIFANLALDRPQLERRLQEVMEGTGERIAGLVDPRHPIELWRNWTRVMADLTELSESPTRQGVFRRVSEHPEPVDVASRRPQRAIAMRASYESREASIDFRRGGALRPIFRLAAFFGPNLQGADKFVRTVGNHPLRALIAGAIIMLIELGLHAWNSEQEGYDNVPGWQRDLFFIVGLPGKGLETPWGNVKFLRIPGPFEYKLVFGTIPRRIAEYIAGTEPELGKRLIESIGRTGANPIPTFALPLLENLANWNFFRDRPIEPRGMEDLVPSERFSPHTSETAKRIGNLLEYSPNKIDNLINGYLGTSGQSATWTLDQALKAFAQETPYGEPPTTPVTDWPLIRGFVLRVPSLQADAVERFYQYREQSVQAKRSLDKIQREGRPAEAFQRDHAWELSIASTFEQESRRFSEWRKQMVGIERDPRLTGDQKRARLDAAAKDLVERAKQKVAGANLERRALEIAAKLGPGTKLEDVYRQLQAEEAAKARR